MKSSFITNYSKIKFLDEIKKGLNECNAFKFSVSFIKKAGLNLLTNEIEEALKRGINGKIIVSTYQNFTDITSLEYFLSLMNTHSNFECHIDFNCFDDNGFHTKGYIFDMNDSNMIIIGSTNITRFALLKNIEWNLSINSDNKEKYYEDIKNEFNFLWDKTMILNTEIIRQYSNQLNYAIERWDMDYISDSNKVICPNLMQRKALKEIRRYRDIGVNKALIIAATGSGKTYLAAFDALNYDAKRLLFVVHRDVILKAAKDTFNEVFGSTRSYGLFNGNVQELNRDFIFATPIMLVNHLPQFSKDEFDYIIIDEAQHSVVDSIKKILNYFEPGFILGLTATPERMDNQDVFEMFDQNVPYELRLRDALLNDLIVPFKYYGIWDKLINYSKNDALTISRQIAEESNIEFIINEIEKHKPNGKLKVLAFCTSIAHANTMADKFNEHGYSTIALTGNNNLMQRIKTFNNLQDENNELKIICTVDILNEGVDIPCVNMILFLRPTESSTIFIQQLGRGLRKYPGKEYVTILDFIGNNYDRSVQIALALGTLNNNNIIEKNMLMDLIKDDFKQLNLPIEINIDKLSKESIFKYIEKENFNNKKFLVSNYNSFEKYIGKVPTHMDYINNEYAPDIMRFIGKYGSYYNFLEAINKNEIELNDSEKGLLKYLSNLLPLVRPYEFLIFKNVLNEINNIEKIMEDTYNYYTNFDSDQFFHALKLVINRLWNNPSKNVKEEYLRIDNGLLEIINVNITEKFKVHLLDLLDYGLNRYDIEFGDFETKFKLYGNYKTEQIKMVMCEPGLMQVQGTIVKNDGVVYILAGLRKESSVAEHLNYVDKFINKNVFQWESTTNVRIDNEQGMKLINSKYAHLFIRKKESEDGITLPYTYIGTGKLRDYVPGTKSKDTLIFQIELDNEIPEYLRYDFMIK